MTFDRKWLSAALAGFLLGVLAIPLARLGGVAPVSAGELPSGSGTLPALSWSQEGGVWRIDPASHDARLLVFPSPGDQPLAPLPAEVGSFSLAVSRNVGATSFADARLVILEVKPVAMCEHGVCLPCDDLGLCPFPPEPPEPDGPIKSWMVEGRP